MQNMIPGTPLRTVHLPPAFQDASSSNGACRRAFHGHGGKCQRQNLVLNCVWLERELVEPAVVAAQEVVKMTLEQDDAKYRICFS